MPDIRDLNFIDPSALRLALDSGILPGQKAHKMLAPPAKKKYGWHIPEGAKVSSVLILIYPKNDAQHILFMQRTSHPKDKHAGQISFPGGKYEQEDKNKLNTALRETEEETGVTPSEYEILGELSPFYIPVSNFLVYPFVAWAREKLNFTPEVSEVERLVEIPLQHLLDSPINEKTKVAVRNGFTIVSPAFVFEEATIWGATSMILNELLVILRNLNT